MPQPIEPDWDDELGGYSQDASANIIRDADDALFPDGTNLVRLAMKARVNPQIKAQADHILSMAIRRGELDAVFGHGVGKKMNAATSLLWSDHIHSIGMSGLSRDELIEAFGALPTMNRRGPTRSGGPAAGEF